MCKISKSVRIVGETGYGHGTKVFAEDGSEIGGVEEAHIDPITVNKMIAVSLKLCAVAFDLRAEARFLVADPRTGKLGEVRSITFADGETVEFQD